MKTLHTFEITGLLSINAHYFSRRMHLAKYYIYFEICMMCARNSIEHRSWSSISGWYLETDNNRFLTNPCHIAVKKY